MSKPLMLGKRKNVLKEIDDIADSIPTTMKEQPDGFGNTRYSSLQSTFQESRKELARQKQIGGIDEKYNKLALEKLAEMLEELIPIAERQYRKYPGDRFAAMSLTNFNVQLRDVMNDLRSIQTFEAQADRLKRNNMLVFQNILQNFVDEMYKIRKEIQSGISNKDMLEKVIIDIVNSHGLYLKESLQSVNAKVDEQLVRDSK